ncbi:MAG: hypothetical protein WAL40_05650, partial [Rhodoplanes sp.]
LYFLSKSAKRYVYWWVDGIYLEARLEDQAQCILVIIGARRLSQTSCINPALDSFFGCLLENRPSAMPTVGVLLVRIAKQRNK